SLFSLLSFGTACTEFVPVEATDPTAELRLNEIQVIGSHNSYKTQPSDLLHAAIELVYGFLPPDSGVESPDGLIYSHPSLTEQFGALGTRQIELDIWPRGAE
ncbi:MAG: Ca2+-dependent phosphoinositide-specific phospholipase C, partial [Myxococcota bacterium]|nr:Ca2+-dependent phosphoinositide-specific phospholipase C [Myxococcota bacterium]